MLTFEVVATTGHVPDVHQRTIAAALAVLDARGITLEQCMAASARPAKQHQPDHVTNFFEGRREEGMALIEAQAVAGEICGQDVRLLVVDRPDQLSH